MSVKCHAMAGDFFASPGEINGHARAVSMGCAPAEAVFSPRMSDPNEIYYVVLRGPGRQPLFNNDDDRTHFTAVVAHAAKACGVTVFAYCWLQAEARLAVGLADVSISRFAQRVAKEHARRVEREVSLTGAHFEQKYRGVKVDGQTALADLVRHLHLAPIKAGLAVDPTEYLWSSHRAYLGLSEEPWVTREPLLKHFERTEGDGVRGYIRFVNQGAMNLEELNLPASAARRNPQESEATRNPGNAEDETH